MSETVRLFLGIDVHLSVCEKLMLVQEQLHPIIEGLGAEVRWTSPEHLHLTLLSLGDLDSALARPVQQRVAAVVAQREPLRFEASGVAAHPSGQTPRVLYARISEGAEGIGALRDALEDALTELGLPRDPRPFEARVTLGRVRTPGARVDLSEVLGAIAELPLGPSEAWDVVTLQSHLTPQGAKLQVRERAFFAGVCARPPHQQPPTP